MKKMMGIAVVALLLAAGSAMAGWRSDDNVVIGYTARGALGTVRNSSYPAEDIGCRARVGPASYNNNYKGSYFGECWATNSAGTRRTCTTGDEFVVRHMAALNGDSIVEFAWASTSGSDCLYVEIGNGSDYRPKLQ